MILYSILVGFIIFYLIKDHNLKNYTNNFKGEDLLSSTYLILVFIFSLIENTLSFLVIFFFSPTLFMVTDIINPIIYWVVSLFQNEIENKALYIILNSLGYSIVLFCSLIYNEIIILNCFGLNRNTKKYLEKKQKEDLSSIMDNHIDDEPLELKNETD